MILFISRMEDRWMRSEPLSDGVLAGDGRLEEDSEARFPVLQLGTVGEHPQLVLVLVEVARVEGVDCHSELPLRHSPLAEIRLDVVQLCLLECVFRRFDVAKGVRDVQWIFERDSEPMIGPA